MKDMIIFFCSVLYFNSSEESIEEKGMIIVISVRYIIMKVLIKIEMTKGKVQEVI